MTEEEAAAGIAWWDAEVVEERRLSLARGHTGLTDLEKVIPVGQVRESIVRSAGAWINLDDARKRRLIEGVGLDRVAQTDVEADFVKWAARQPVGIWNPGPEQ